jgi:transcriptional regulator with XRE-family HTH domain
MAEKTSKKRSRPKLSSEEVAMADLMKSRAAAIDKTQSELAAEIGVTQGMFSHWLNKKERVPANRARALADVLGLAPEDVSIAYRQENDRDRKLRDDILALRFAVTGIATALSAKRQGEGVAFDSAIREVASKFPEFLDEDGPGWLPVLLGQIAVARNTAAAGIPDVQVKQAASSSKRKR